MPIQINVKVSTFYTDFEFQMDSRARGSTLYDLVCKTMGIREVWYFGLFFYDTKGFRTWPLNDKRVLDQGIPKDSSLQLYFGVKYYPEDVAEELIQEITQHLFYLEIKKLIISGEIYCPPEAALLLSSYSVQSKFGDYDPSVYKPGFLRNHSLIPDNVKRQFQMSQDMWEDRIVAWYSQRLGLLSDEAELEYLKIAQDLEMYGVSYFEIKNKRGTNLWLGVDSLGLSIYEFMDKITPKIAFPWSEIRNISFNDKKFVIKPVDRKSPDFTFFASRVRINRQILQLCIGNHEQFLRKRNIDSMELQQIKVQAKEDRAKKQLEKSRLKIEKQTRITMEKERVLMEQELLKYKEEIEATKEALERQEFLGKVLIDKMHKVEEDSVKFAQIASEAREEVKRVRQTAFKTEEEKLAMEKIVLSFEASSRRVQKEVEIRSIESDNLKTELSEAIQAERLAKENLLKVLGDPIVLSNEKRYPEPKDQLANTLSIEFDESTKIAELKHKIEQDQINYIVKSSYLNEQMTMLRQQMESLKIREMMSLSDIQHEEKVGKGENKYSTINKVKEGTTKNRIAFFEEL